MTVVRADACRPRIVGRDCAANAPGRDGIGIADLSPFAGNAG
jgi:hypothetical protein